MRKRVDQLGVAEPEIQRSGEDQIDVSLPDVENADEAAQRRSARRPSSSSTTGRPTSWARAAGPTPTNAEVTGGPQAGNEAAALSRYDAVKRAATCAPRDYGGESTRQFYLVDERAKRVLAGPEENEAEARAGRARAQPGGGAQRRGRGRAAGHDRRARRAGRRGRPRRRDRWYVLRDKPALSGTDIKNPEQNFDQGAGGTGGPERHLRVLRPRAASCGRRPRARSPSAGRSRSSAATRRAAYQHFAIVLDNELISAPYIDFQQNPDGIDGDTGSEISGGFTIESAQRLADLLKSGALPIRLELISSSQVSATLGQQALDQGLIAGIAGFAVVALFLLVFYRVLGLIAVGALGVYAVFFFALIELIPITLTLPGIAGLILTIGVAADANIVIFERVKEEIRAGRSVAAGIAAGYKRGLSAIIDANVVTFMVAFILFTLATAGIKGFAFTLGVGTLVSFITAVLLTQAALGVMGRSRIISSPTSLGAGEQKRRWSFDFMGLSKWFFSASGVILLVCALAVGGKGLNFGIDFESGTRIKTELRQSTDEDGVRSVLARDGLGDAEVQRLSGEEIRGDNGFQISTEELTPAQRQAVRTGLNQEFGVATFNFDSIGPTFGQTVARTATIAIIASLIVISAYIALRFEWKYAVPVLIALAHDLLITGGVYALLGREVTASTVAALLTILGFSLYDTIIVFDRVRENVPRMPRAAFSQIVNRSMSEVLTRSLATSFCTLLPILALYFFGGETLKDFAFALIVGTASGTYSSVFIAGPLLTHWKERDQVYARRRARIVEELGYVPAYATTVGGTPPDIAPEERKRPPRRLTEPEHPERQVSASEFDSMVRDLHADAPPTRTATAVEHEPEPEPARRAERDPEPEPEPEGNGAPQPDGARDLDPEDLVMKEPRAKRDKPKRPRNRKHGRSR